MKGKWFVIEECLWNEVRKIIKIKYKIHKFPT